MRTLTHKGESRLYLQSMELESAAHDIIRDMDEFEFDYMPQLWCASYADYPETVYTHKFSDLDMDVLVSKCWALGIKCWVYDKGRTDF